MNLSESDEIILFNNVTKNIFPNLNTEEKKLLNHYLVKLLNILINSFNIDDYRNELYSNNYRNAKWLLLYLLPFINTSTKSYDEIYSLNDIYVKKLSSVNLEKEEPKYIWSNLQYGRCNRENLTEIDFNVQHLEHNYYLLVDTILSVSHKLYANWLNIIPFTLNDLDEITNDNNNDENKSKFDIKLKSRLKKLYTSTNNYIKNNNIADIDIINPEISRLNSMYIGTLYDTLANYLYYSIYNYKFLIYDILATVDNFTHPIPIILILKNMFDLILIRDSEWDILPASQQQQLEIAWKYYLDRANNSKNITRDNLNIESEDLQKILMILIISFEKKYRNIENAKEDGYILIETEPDEEEDEGEEDEDEDEDLSIRKMNYEKIKESINSVDFKHIYTFLKDVLEGIQYTWYGYHLFNLDKSQIKDAKSFRDEFMMRKEVQIKMVYNFCKSLIHDKKRVDNHTRYVPYPKYWRSLDTATRRIILDRLNNRTRLTDWFNINRYFRTLIKYGSLGLKAKAGVRENIVVLNIATLTPAQLRELHEETYSDIKKHLLEIICECLIINGIFSTYMPCTVMESLNKKNNIWSSSYHFLTNTPYQLMRQFSVENKDGEVVKTDFFQQALKPREFKTYGWYEVDPFMLISQLGFAHKFIHNRVVYITGATGAGKSSQVPKLYMYYLKAIDMNNTGSVVCSQPRIKPTEDTAVGIARTLGLPIYEEAERNIYDRRKPPPIETNNYYVQMQYKAKSHKISRVNHITLKIITDGSLLQELNNPVLKVLHRNKETNMIDKITNRNIYDIIIIDESHEHNKNMDIILTLTRYALNLNNSIRLIIMSATLDNDEPVYRRYYRDINDNRKAPLDMWIRDNMIDRINVDRRFHFSPPDKTTRFLIKETYLPDENPDELVVKLVKSTPSGNILLFQSGQRDINESISFINENTPSNVIAIPYISNLDEDHKKFVGDIDKTQKDLHISKIQDFGTTENLKVGKGNYDRVVIVATNIAEASITIDSLKYVVETGTQKTNIYDYKKRINLLKESRISESSRIQRKGRVGRTSDGFAFFIYHEGELKNNKIQFKISIEDLTAELFKFLRNSNEEMRFIQNDPNNPNFRFISREGEWTVPYYLNLTIENMFYDYYGNRAMYDYENYKSPPSYAQTGYPSRILSDNDGTFYVIHPDELIFKRNIRGDIVEILSDDLELIEKYRIKSKKVESFWNTLEEDKFIKKLENRNLVKTELGIIMMEILEKIVISSNETESLELKKSILVGWANGMLIQMIKLISFINTISFDITNLLLHIDEKPQIHRLKAIYNDDYRSDSAVLLAIFDDLEKYILKQDSLINYLENTYYYANENILKTPMDSKRIIEYLNGKIDYSLDNEHNYELLDKNLYEYIDDLIDSLNLEEWAHRRGLNYRTLITVYKNYYKLKHNINKIMHKYSDKMAKLLQLLKQQYDIDKIVSSDDSITKIFLLIYPRNIGVKTSENTYKQFDDEKSTYTIGSFGYKYKPKILFDKLYLEKRILHLSLNSSSGTVSMIHYIKN